MKRFTCTVLLVFATITVYGADFSLSAGTGGLLGGLFTRYSLTADGSIGKGEAIQETNQFNYGAFVFFDATYGIFTVSFQNGHNNYKQDIHDDTEKIGMSGKGWESMLGFSLLGKYPFKLNDRFTVFPLLGVEYQISLVQLRTDPDDSSRVYRRDDGIMEMDKDENAFKVTDWNSFFINVGGGVDYSLSKNFYLRGELLCGFRLKTPYEQKNLDMMIDLTGDSKPKLGGITVVPTFRLSVGYTFYNKAKQAKLQPIESRPTTAPSPETIPRITQAPESAPEIAQVSEPTPDAALSPESAPEITPIPESIPEIAQVPEPIPEIAPMPEPTPEIVLVPETIPEIAMIPGLIPEIAPSPEPIPEIALIPEPTPEVASPFETVPEIVPSPPEPTPEIVLAPETIPEIALIPEPAPEITPIPEPTPEVALIPETIPGIALAPEPTPEIAHAVERMDLPETPVLPAQYLVKSWTTTRDCLWNIAGKPEIYGDPWQWRRIYDANRDKMPRPDDPDLIHPGMILDIPSIAGEFRAGIMEE